MKRSTLLSVVILGSLSLSGLISCKKSETAAPGKPWEGDPSKPITVGKFTILETLIDGRDQTEAKRQAENAITKHNADITAFIGLWSYNAPQILEALKTKSQEGKIRVFAFDEDPSTIAAISAGNCDGTFAQQPYEFGYQSMKYLKDVIDGKEVKLDAEKAIPVPGKILTKENMEEFRAKLAELKAGAAAAAPAPEGSPKFAFVVNNSSDFWSYADAGLRKAGADLGIIAEFLTPTSGNASDQNRVLQNILQKGDFKGVAISPIEPDNQTEILNKVADTMPLICHDSDAPMSKRLFYIGTNNTDAGREMGKFIKKQLPNGGKLIIAVGSLDALNAKQRRAGVIEELGK